MKTYRGKVHYGIGGVSRSCVRWQVGERYPAIMSSMDWSEVTCKRCLAMR